MTKRRGGGSFGTFALVQEKVEDAWNGTWMINLIGTWEDLYYTYLVTIDDTEYEIADPYSWELGSTGERSRIVNFTGAYYTPGSWTSDKHVYFDDQLNKSVYRLNVADFTADGTSGVNAVGKYLGLTESGTTIGGHLYAASSALDHLQLLGVTAVELDGVTSVYNPAAPNTDLSSGEYTVAEFRRMVQALHNAGISVILRVPYAYSKNVNNAFLNAVPNYYYRLDANGKLQNFMGSFSEFATERAMYRNYLTTSLLNWVNNYHIDGFTFVESGRMDTETLHVVRAALDETDAKIALFADGITAQETVHPSKTCTGVEFLRANHLNAAELPATVRLAPTVLSSAYSDITDLLGVSATVRDETAVRKAKFIAGLLATSGDVWWINAGDEMCASDSRLNWNNAGTYSDVVSYYRGLLFLRRYMPELAEGGLGFTWAGAINEEGAGSLVVKDTDGKGWGRILLAYNAGAKPAEVAVAVEDGKCNIIVSAGFAGVDSADVVTVTGGKLTVPACTLLVLVENETYKAAESAPGWNR